MAKKISKGDLTFYKDINPDTIYKPGSMTFIYTTSGNLYIEPHPTNHRDMMEKDDIFFDVYPDLKRAKVTPKKRIDLSSRGQVLENSKALLGRIGAIGDAIAIVLWTEPAPQVFGSFLATLFKKFPQFHNAQDKTIVVSPGGAEAKGGARMLTDIIGGDSKTPKRTISLKKKSIFPAETPPSADTKYDIAGKSYSLNDLQKLRSAIHTKGPLPLGLDDPYAVLCHPDLAKYLVLHGYRPANCGGEPAPALRQTHPAMWRQAGREIGADLYTYGEGFTFRDWIEFQNIFRS